MKNNRKALIMSVCIVLIVAATIFGTVAYLTDSDSALNTFTVGSIGLKLDEAKVNEMGEEQGDERWQPTANDPAQAYHLLPGHTYTKDPTVTVDAGSDNAYIRMMVTVTFENALDDAQLATSLDTIFTGYDAAKWERAAKDVSADKKTITYEYRYFQTVDNSESTTDLPLKPLFTEIKVPGTMTNEEIANLQGMEILVEAHAIQATGFENADAAWAAFAVQHP